MKNFTAQSCHSIGYAYDIDAPEELNADDIEAVLDALIDYTDTPDNAALQSMLSDEFYTQELDTNKMTLYKQISISVECVHREMFTQEIEEA